MFQKNNIVNISTNFSGVWHLFKKSIFRKVDNISSAKINVNINKSIFSKYCFYHRMSSGA